MLGPLRGLGSIRHKYERFIIVRCNVTTNRLLCVQDGIRFTEQRRREAPELFRVDAVVRRLGAGRPIPRGVLIRTADRRLGV